MLRRASGKYEASSTSDHLDGLVCVEGDLRHAHVLMLLARVQVPVRSSPRAQSRPGFEASSHDSPSGGRTSQIETPSRIASRRCRRRRRWTRTRAACRRCRQRTEPKPRNGGREDWDEPKQTRLAPICGNGSDRHPESDSLQRQGGHRGSQALTKHRHMTKSRTRSSWLWLKQRREWRQHASKIL